MLPGVLGEAAAETAGEGREVLGVGDHDAHHVEGIRERREVMDADRSETSCLRRGEKVLQQLQR